MNFCKASQIDPGPEFGFTEQRDFALVGKVVLAGRVDVEFQRGCFPELVVAGDDQESTSAV